MEAALAAKSMMVKTKTHKKKKKNLVGPNMSGTVMDSDALWTDRHPLFLQKVMMKEEHHTDEKDQRDDEGKISHTLEKSCSHETQLAFSCVTKEEQKADPDKVGPTHRKTKINLTNFTEEALAYGKMNLEYLDPTKSLLFDSVSKSFKDVINELFKKTRVEDENCLCTLENKLSGVQTSLDGKSSNEIEERIAPPRPRCSPGRQEERGQHAWNKRQHNTLISLGS